MPRFDIASFMKRKKDSKEELIMKNRSIESANDKLRNMDNLLENKSKE